MEEVAHLLERGANPGVRDAHGHPPLHIALEQGHFRVAEALLKHDAKEFLSHIEHEWHETPLHKAAALGKAKFVKMFLRHRPDTEARQWKGKKPTDLAAEAGHSDVAQILQNHGAGRFHH